MAPGSADTTIETASADPARWWLLAGVWLLYAGFGLIATSLAPLVAPIELELRISHTAMGSIMGAWQLVYIFSAVPAGRLLDRMRSRDALLIGALLLSLSAFGRSVADGYWAFLFAVMVFGLGGPIVSSGAPKVISEWFVGRERGLAMGIYMTGPALGGVVSLTLTHPLLLPAFDGDWRDVYRLWAVVMLFAGAIWWLIAAWHRRQTDEGPAAAAAEPGLSVRDLIRLPGVGLVLAMSVGVFLYNHGLNNWLPELLRASGMTASVAGYWAALPTVVGIAGSLLIPRLATPERRFRIMFWLALAAAGASLLLQFSSGAPLAVGLVLQGIARSSMMTVLILTLVELPGIGQRYAGSASGLFFSAAEVGGVLGPLGLGLAFDLTGGFGLGLGVLTGVACALAFAVLRLARIATGPNPSAA
ncbi:MAG: MFS transporter [Pseudomonadota bacterium]